MQYQPKEVWNPTGHVVEVVSGNEHFIFQPQEKKLLNGFEAYQILTHQNSPLEEYKGEDSKKEDEKIQEIDKREKTKAFSEMSWLELRRIAVEKGIFKLSMKKKDLITALIENSKVEGVPEEGIAV